MEHESKSLEYKVGIFVALGLAMVAFSILILGGNKVLFTKYVYFYADFKEVQGLFSGSVVSLAGMPIGNVEEIEFVPGSETLTVKMMIDAKFHGRLTEGTTADIRTQGALGDKYIYLNPGPVTGSVLADGSKVKVDDSGDILKMLASKEDGVGRALELIKEMHILVANLNANGRVAGMVENASQATAQLKRTMIQLDGLLGDLREQMPENKKLKTAVANLASVLEKIDQGKGTLGLLVNDPSLHQSLKSFLGGSPRNRYMKDIIRESIQQNEASK